ncbi:MAG: hypothetical protein AAGD22_06145 [Verrucomicrobiota bacterium]
MKIVKLLSIITAVFLAAHGVSNAYIISINAATVPPSGGGISNAAGSALTPAAGLLQLGFFTADGTLGGAVLDNAGILALGADPLALSASFVQVAQTTNITVGPNNGFVNETIAIASNPDGEQVTPFTFAEYDTNINGKDVYAFVLGTNTVEAGSDFGVFDLGASTFVSGADAANNLTSVSLAASDVTALYGSTTGPVIFPNAPASIQLVPEPSVGLFGMIAAFGMVLRRRRARS